MDSDIKNLFSEQNLCSLTLGEYVNLLRSYGGNMVTHVTRQGIRDHIGHMNHTRGLDKFSDSFKNMLCIGHLRSPLGIFLGDEFSPETCLEALKHHTNSRNKKESWESLEKFVDFKKQNEPGSYVDKNAIHFCVEQVADFYYGSEKQNEIFIAFPTLFIASQYHFGGFLEPDGDQKWNDLYVWTGSHKGIDLDAGLVFIPERTLVNPSTGSRYKTDSEGKPIVNQEYIQKILEVVKRRDFYDLAEKIMEVTGKMHRGEKTLSDPRIKEFCSELEKKFGVTDPMIQDILTDYHALFSFNCHFGDSCRVSGIAKGSLRERGIYYIEAKNSIQSKEFWENYFLGNPDKKPSKIIYYPEPDSNQGLNNWLKKNSIEVHKISRDDPLYVNGGYKDSNYGLKGILDFTALAKQAIKVHNS